MSEKNVQTKYGAVSGVNLDGKFEGVRVYRGVPYAKPPVGELRFRPPVEPDCWDGVRKCDTFAKIPIQRMPIHDESFEPYGKDFYWEGVPETSEDCLYLNIHTAAQDDNEKRPVYIWFHGGGLGHGFSYERECDGSMLAKKGVVVVSVGQRLNVFGYLTLPQLSDEQGGHSGNYGLMDEVMAVRWVIENISAFGGDPNNITLGGQSGGTSKTSPLLGVSELKGHVKRLISESGLKRNLAFISQQQAEENGLAYLDHIGVDRNITPEELRKLDPWVLYGDGKGPENTMHQDGSLIWADNIRPMWETAGKIDFLCGCNLGEVPPQAKVVHGQYSPFTTKEEFYANVKEILGESYDTCNFEKILPVTDENAWITARRLAAQGLTLPSRQNMSRNIMLNRKFGVERAAKEPGSKVYTYLFAHVLPSRPEDAGTLRDSERLMAYHSSELWYVFASFDEGVPPVRPWRDADYQVADMTSSYWANFMATGDPNGDGLPYWPSASEEFGWLEIAEQPVAHKGMEGELDRILDAFVGEKYEI